MDRLPFYFDFISPYAYLGFHEGARIAMKRGLILEPIPVLFAALLNENKQLGPAEIPRKRVYIFKDVVRTAKVLGLPFAAPKHHPFNPLLALRVASTELDDEERVRVVSALFAAVWVDARDVTNEEDVANVLHEAGFDAARLLRDAKSDGVKARVRAQTDALLARGGFGVPSLWVDGELFWGVDSFAHAERRMEGKDPIGEVDPTPWLAVTAQSERTRRD